MARTDPQVNFRMPADLKERLEDAAKKQGRSVTQEIIQRLEHSFTPWEERPWEDRMVTDINRAMLKLLTKDEYGMLLDRVKAAGGADTVNGYAPTVVRSTEDLQPPIPDGPRLRELAASLPPPASKKDAIARELALAVLRMTENIPDEWDEAIEASVATTTKMLEPIDNLVGQTGPKEDLGAAPKEPKEPKRRMINRKRRMIEDDKEKNE